MRSGSGEAGKRGSGAAGQRGSGAVHWPSQAGFSASERWSARAGNTASLADGYGLSADRIPSGWDMLPGCRHPDQSGCAGRRAGARTLGIARGLRRAHGPLYSRSVGPRRSLAGTSRIRRESVRAGPPDACARPGSRPRRSRSAPRGPKRAARGRAIRALPAMRYSLPRESDESLPCVNRVHGGA
jgi:hypothetical protein